MQKFSELDGKLKWTLLHWYLHTVYIPFQHWHCSCYTTGIHITASFFMQWPLTKVNFYLWSYRMFFNDSRISHLTLGQSIIFIAFSGRWTINRTVGPCNGSLFSQRLIYSTGCEPIPWVQKPTSPNVIYPTALWSTGCATLYRGKIDNTEREKKLSKEKTLSFRGQVLLINSWRLTM